MLLTRWGRGMVIILFKITATNKQMVFQIYLGLICRAIHSFSKVNSILWIVFELSTPNLYIVKRDHNDSCRLNSSAIKILILWLPKHTTSSLIKPIIHKDRLAKSFYKHLPTQNNTPGIHSAQTRAQNTDIIRVTSMLAGHTQYLVAKELANLTLISYPQAKYRN